jgi:hypothetical protein
MPRRVPIEDWIDLHGLSPRDVPAAAADYIEAASRAGFSEVRLVHGKGKGVQRRRVQEMLASHRLVLGFRNAPPTRGGLGATLAWLRAVDATGRLRWLWRASQDDDDGHGWRGLLSAALERADRLELSARARGPLSLRFGSAFPFLHLERAPGAEEIFDALPLEPIERREGARWRSRFALDDGARRYLLETCAGPAGWDQRAGLPESPTLLAGDQVVLAADGDEVVIHLSADERARLSDVDLAPL